MPTVVQLRRGTTAQNTAFTGAAGELTFDTTLGTLRVHDNSTAGGNVLVAVTATQTLTNKTIPVIAGVTTITGNLVANSATASTSTTTGALVVVGGVGVSGAIYAGSIQNTPIGSTTASTGNFSTLNTTGTHTAATINAGTIGNSGATLTGTLSTAAQTNITSVGTITSGTWSGSFGAVSGANLTNLTAANLLGTAPTSNVSIYDSFTATTTNATFYPQMLDKTTGNGAGFTASTLTHNPSTGALSATSFNGIGTFSTATTSSTLIASGNVVAASGTASTSATTGALVVAGGAGISGNVFTSGWVVPTANVSQNLGTTTSWWGTFYGVSTQAKYADLAENYQADTEYEPGTVLVFGGEYEVTTTTTDHDERAAGVVSTNPAHLMNGGLSGTNVVALGLTGRVPCRVLGPVNKGTVLVTSTIPGVAQAIDNSQFRPGCIIGKALQSINTISINTIEVVVGRF
jgi:hypothetical protein